MIDYDHAGERTAKVTGMNQESHYDGSDVTGRTSLRYTLYPSQYITYSSGGRYTKHIYAGSQRIASVTGVELSDPSRVVPHAGTEGSLSDTIKVDFAKLYKKQTQEYDTLYPRYEVRRMANDTDGIVRQQEPQTYFYHTDHLGSTTLVTSRDGQVQQVSYMPYGEVFLEQRNKNWNTPYLFNGKEQDEESGLYYYGARYYDARKSLWLSVDPLAEIYPHITPYAYCLNNPVRLVDPDGCKVKPKSDEEFGMIKNTIPEEDRQYVVLDKEGYIDVRSINKHKSKSRNYNKLKEMVNSYMVVNVEFTDQYLYSTDNGIELKKMKYIPYEPVPEGWEEVIEDSKDPLGITVEGVSSGESGNLGKSLFPDLNAKERSLDDECYVFINKCLSREGAAETFSHEGYGHILLYIRNGGDYYGACHLVIEMVETNLVLKQMILEAKQETIQNMKR